MLSVLLRCCAANSFRSICSQLVLWYTTVSITLISKRGIAVLLNVALNLLIIVHCINYVSCFPSFSFYHPIHWLAFLLVQAFLLFRPVQRILLVIRIDGDKLMIPIFWPETWRPTGLWSILSRESLHQPWLVHNRSLFSVRNYLPISSSANRWMFSVAAVARWVRVLHKRASRTTVNQVKRCHAIQMLKMSPWVKIVP